MSPVSKVERPVPPPITTSLNDPDFMSFRLLAVCAGFCIQAFVVKLQARDRLAVNEMGFNNFRDVFYSNSTVPDCLRINHYDRTVFTLIKAAGFVGSDLTFQSAFGKFLLEFEL